MRSHITKIISNTHKLGPKIVANRKSLNTTADPKHASGLVMPGVQESGPDFLIQEPLFPSVELPNADVFSYIFQHAQKWQNKIGLECGITGRQFTYAQTIDGALKFSSAIGKLLPNESNPTVAFLCPNSPEFSIMFFGCLSRGATVTPINPLYTPEEIARHINDSNASLLVVDAMVEPLADMALKLVGKDIPIMVNGQSDHNRPNVQEIISDPTAPMADPVDIDPSSIAFLPYSSGTTGRPKGVRLSHAAMTNFMAMCYNSYFSGCHFAEGNHQDRMLCILPYFHIYGVVANLMPGAYYGTKTVTLPLFEPSMFAAALKKLKATYILTVPPLLQFMANSPMITKEDLSSLHSLVVGGAPTPLSISAAVKEKAPHAMLQEGYGMTEALLITVTAQEMEKIGYCGHLIPNCRAKIIDTETGELLPANTNGELCVQTPSVMSGYHNNDEATRETIDDEGWIHTGDIAFYTEDGYYSIVDRIKELIKVKGLQVSPSELEETLTGHPGIADAGVIGVPHSRSGEAPMAFIIKSDPLLTEEDVHQHMSAHLTKHKQLDGGIKFVTELPKSQTGKLLRRVLKGMAEDVVKE